MKSKTFDFLRKLIYRRQKNVHPKTQQKKKEKEKTSMRSFLTEKTPYQDILLPPILRLSRGNESQAIKFLPVCSSVKIINSYCAPLHGTILSLICGLTVEIL